MSMVARLYPKWFSAIVWVPSFKNKVETYTPGLRYFIIEREDTGTIIPVQCTTDYANTIKTILGKIESHFGIDLSEKTAKELDAIENDEYKYATDFNEVNEWEELKSNSIGIYTIEYYLLASFNMSVADASQDVMQAIQSIRGFSNNNPLSEACKNLPTDLTGMDSEDALAGFDKFIKFFSFAFIQRLYVLQKSGFQLTYADIKHEAVIEELKEVYKNYDNMPADMKQIYEEFLMDPEGTLAVEVPDEEAPVPDNTNTGAEVNEF